MNTDPSANPTNNAAENKKKSFHSRLWELIKRDTNFAEWCIVLFTGVLAVSAIYQFNVMRGQLDEMQNALTLQTKAVKAEYGPYFKDDWISMKKKGDSIWIAYQIKNTGKTPAEKMTIAMKLEFRPSPPTKSECDGLSEYRNMIPETAQANGLQPVFQQIDWVRGQMQAPPSLPAYMWGAIGYTDFLGRRETITFCRVASALTKDALVKAETTSGGYNTGWDYCECKK